MSVTAVTSLALLMLIAKEFQSSSASISVPHRSIKQPIRLDLDLNDWTSKESDGILAEAFRREVARARRQDDSGSFADATLTNATITADNHTSALLYWSGQVVFILTKGHNNETGVPAENHLWRSLDSGISFEDVTSQLPPSAVVEDIWPSPNPNIILFSDRVNKRLYQLDHDDTTSTQLQFSPDTLLFQSCQVDSAELYGKYILGYDKVEKSLWVTNNIQTWTQLGENVTAFFWRELNSSIEHPSTVYFDKRVNYTASLLYVANESTYDQPQLLFPKLGVVMPNTFSLSHQYMFVQKNYSDIGLYHHSDRSSLWVSFFRGPFREARFPVDDSDKHYAVVDASQNRVLLVMYSFKLNSSCLYQSDKHGVNYSLSLDNIAVASTGLVGDPVFDVYKVQGLPATYLATRKLLNGNFNYTYITFNGGGRWTSLKPPVVDSRGNLVECEAPCSLHLHLLADTNRRFSQILSAESAPGFIMAVGNVGSHLEQNTSVTRLYVSHNGGVHWEESLAVGSYGYYQVLDYGVYTLFVKRNNLIGSILVSCDQGRNWTSVSSIHSIHVSGLVIDPKAATSQQAIIYGYRTGSGTSSLEVFTLNFENNGIPECTVNDYNLWAQSSRNGLQTCVLGERHVYERRNLETCCYITEEYVYTTNHTICLCTEDDFECDFGFYRKDQLSTCDPMPGSEYPPLPPAHCPEGTYYSYSSGYRKIAGDHCVEGNETFAQPVVKLCPIVAPDGLHILVTSQNISTFPVQTPINFTLLQTKGSQLSTSYLWRFGDNDTYEVTGFDNASSISHVYDRPGTYTVIVIASNDAGESGTSMKITVLDVIKHVSVDGPSFVAVGTQVSFYARVQTQLRTEKYTPAYFKWMVNGQPVLNQDGPCYSRKFLNQTTVNVSVVVINALGVNDDSMLVEVTEVPAIVITAMKGNRTLSLSDHIPAMSDISFSVQPRIDNQSFPSDMDFYWVFSPMSEAPVIPQKSGGNLTINVQLCAGEYVLAVSGKSSIGVASSSITIIVEEKIDVIHVEGIQPGYRQFTNISAVVSVFTRDGNLTGYSGDVQLELWQGANFTHHDLLYSSSHLIGRNHSSLSLDYPMTVSGVYTLRFVCHNDIPSYKHEDHDVFIADSNQYEYIRLIFSGDDLPSNYTSKRWSLELQANITEQLMNYLGVQRWQLEVTLKEELSVMINNSQHSEDVLIAHVYILPSNLSDESISYMQMVTSQFLEDANNGEIAFSTKEDEVLLSSAESGFSSTHQFCPKPTIEPNTCYSSSTMASTTAVVTSSTDSHHLALVVGFAVGLICLIIIVIQLVVIIGMCYTRHKKSFRHNRGYVQMGEFEHPVKGTVTVTNESLDEVEVDTQDDDEDDTKDNEEAAFIAHQSSPKDESNF